MIYDFSKLKADSFLDIFQRLEKSITSILSLVGSFLWQTPARKHPDDSGTNKCTVFDDAITRPYCCSILLMHMCNNKL